MHMWPSVAHLSPSVARNSLHTSHIYPSHAIDCTRRRSCTCSVHMSLSLALSPLPVTFTDRRSLQVISHMLAHDSSHDTLRWPQLLQPSHTASRTPHGCLQHKSPGQLRLDGCIIGGKRKRKLEAGPRRRDVVQLKECCPFARKRIRRGLPACVLCE